MLDKDLHADPYVSYKNLESEIISSKLSHEKKIENLTKRNTKKILG